MSDKTTFAVNDMTCGHCLASVREALESALPGAEISVDLATHRVAFTGDRTVGEAAIKEAGYTPESVG